MRIIKKRKLSSTQTEIKKYIYREKDVVLVAKTQTAGKGTKERKFISLNGGLYFSVLKFNPPKNTFPISFLGCIAVCKTLEGYGVTPKIKWVNDVLAQGKKIAGILTENVYEGEEILYTIIGVGLNVNNQISNEIDNIAISLKSVISKKINKNKLLKEIVKNLFKSYTLDDYLKYCDFLEKEITLKEKDEERKVFCLGIDKSGRLIVDDNGNKREIAVGEISIGV